MPKRTVTILLTLAAAVLLVVSIRLTARYWNWLDTFLGALLNFLLSLPEWLGRPYLLLFGLLFFVPLFVAVIEVISGSIRRTPGNLLWSTARHGFQLCYLLLFQLSVIPVAFLLFPAGFFLQFISLTEAGVRYFGGKSYEALPVLCQWAGTGESACAPALLTFHVGHLLVVILTLKFGARLLDKGADWYADGMLLLENRIVKK
jgi:hypothetical protein